MSDTYSDFKCCLCHPAPWKHKLMLGKLAVDPVTEHAYATIAACLLDRPFSYMPAQHPSNLMRVQ